MMRVERAEFDVSVLVGRIQDAILSLPVLCPQVSCLYAFPILVDNVLLFYLNSINLDLRPVVVWNVTEQSTKQMDDLTAIPECFNLGFHRWIQ